MKRLVQYTLSLVIPQFRLDLNGVHGIAHWVRVYKNARELAADEGVDLTVPTLFSFLHDSQRYDDQVDEHHGHRAVRYVHELYKNHQLPISAGKFHTLCQAIEGHSFGEIDADPVVQCCWDADRLDLGRCGIWPDPRYLCTEHARHPETIRRAVNRSLGVHSNSTQETL